MSETQHQRLEAFTEAHPKTLVDPLHPCKTAKPSARITAVAGSGTEPLPASSPPT